MNTLENTKPHFAGEVSEPRHIRECKLNCELYYKFSAACLVLFQEPCLLIFIHRVYRCQQLLAELFSKDGIDLRPDHAAFLIRCHRRRLCLKTLTDDIGLDFLSGGFNESRIGVDGLTEDVVLLDVEFRRQVLKFLFFRFFSLTKPFQPCYTILITLAGISRLPTR